MNHSLHCRYSTLLRDWSAVYFYNVLTFTDLSQVYDGPILRFFKTLYVKGVSFFPCVSLSFYFFFSPYEWELVCFVHENVLGPCDKTVTLSFCQKFMIWCFLFNSVKLLCSINYCHSIFFKQKHPFAHIFIVKFHTGIINSFSLIYHIKWSSITV